MSFILRFAGLVLIYLAAARIGLSFGVVNSSVTIFWPAGGIALAALLLGGMRYLPAVFLGAYLAALMVKAPLAFALGSSIGNMLETCIGYFLLRYFVNIDLSLSRTRDLFSIIAYGGFIPAIASAMLGPVSLLIANMVTPDILPAIIWRWWRADVLGIAFFTPLILVCVKKRSFLSEGASFREILVLWGASIITGQVVLLGWKMPGVVVDQTLDLVWLFALVIWAGLRTGRRNTALIQLTFLLQALASSYLHIGFFADDFSRYGLANFWMFSMILAAGGMSLAIQSNAQREATKQIALNSEVFTTSNDGIMIVDTNNAIVSVNPAFTALTGYTSQEAIGQNPSMLASGRHGHEFFAEMWKALAENGHWQGEIWNRRKDGTAYLAKLVINTLTNIHGQVVNRIALFADITESKAKQEAIAHHAQHDFLTNLPNRLLFRDRFNQQLALARRHENKFAVIYLDLDEFKPVNDAFGHQVGDQLLTAVAERLQSLVREIDTVSRFGGDEFAILVSEVKAEQDVTTLAEKILDSLSQPFALGSHTVTVSASLGIALYPDHGSDLETIIHVADGAMYQAKHNGKMGYVIAEQPQIPVDA